MGDCRDTLFRLELEEQGMSKQQSAQIIEFPRRPLPRPIPIPTVVDHESWYNADEIQKDQPGRA